MPDRLLDIPRLPPCTQQVAELFETNRHIADRLCGVGVAGEEFLAEVQAPLVEPDRLLDIPRLTPRTQQVAELVQTNRHIADRLCGVGVALQMFFLLAKHALGQAERSLQ